MDELIPTNITYLSRLFSTFFQILSIAGFISSCSKISFPDSESVGAEELVIDSYKIRDGKFFIKELEGEPLVELDPNLLKTFEATIQDGDIIKVVACQMDREGDASSVQNIEKSNGFSVIDGRIFLPGLDPIFVGGMPLGKAKEVIQKEFDIQFDGLEVYVAFEKKTLQKVDLAGMVKKPSVLVDGKKRLFEALSEAQVPVDANFFNSYLVREGFPVPVDMYRLLKKGDMSQNVVLRGGDKIFVAEATASTVMVIGEVNKQGAFGLSSGSLPLKDALAFAGGIKISGNTSAIQIIRGNVLRPKIYTVNIKHVFNLPSASMLLIPGDIVYVSATPIAEWNRFVQLIFPTLTGIELIKKGVSGIITVQ